MAGPGRPGPARAGHFFARVTFLFQIFGFLASFTNSVSKVVRSAILSVCYRLFCIRYFFPKVHQLFFYLFISV